MKVEGGVDRNENLHGGGMMVNKAELAMWSEGDHHSQAHQRSQRST